MYNKNDPNQNDLDILFIFLARNPSEAEKGITGSGALRLNTDTGQLFFAPRSKRNTLILLAEWVDSVLVIRNWARDRGTYSNRNHFSYSLADYSGSILYYLGSKPKYQNVLYIEVEGVIQDCHRNEAKLLASTYLL